MEEEFGQTDFSLFRNAKHLTDLYLFILSLHRDFLSWRWCAMTQYGLCGLQSRSLGLAFKSIEQRLLCLLHEHLLRSLYIIVQIPLVYRSPELGIGNLQLNTTKCNDAIVSPNQFSHSLFRYEFIDWSWVWWYS